MKKLLFLLLVVLTFASCGGTKGGESKTEGKDYSVYANKEAVISPKDAEALLKGEEDVVLIDVRSSKDIMMGHIEGATGVWRPAMSADKGEYEFGGMRATKEKMEKLLGSLGVKEDTTLLLYGKNGNYDAARLWWILKLYGFDNMKFIDGGIKGWVSAGLPVKKGGAKGTQREATEFKFAGEERTELLASLEEVKSVAEGKAEGLVILDTRSTKEHDGSSQKKGAFRKGRIPSKYFIEWSNFINKDADESFKTPEEIKAILSENGITEDMTVISYCQSGVRSAHTTFVLRELLGFKNAKNYDGSWIEWSYNKDLPIETDQK